MTTLELLSKALAAHEAGQLDQANYLYQKIIESNPDNAEVYHLWGITCFQKKELNKAIELISKAIYLEPNNPEFPTR